MRNPLLSKIGDVPAVARLGERAASVPTALWILIAVASGLRLALMATYRPAILAFADTAPYVGMANYDLFGDPSRPIGYPIFLRAAHAISADVDFTILLQHLLGIAAGVILYAAVRRLGAPIWVAVVAAAAVLLPVDQIGLEHTLGSEGFFTFVFICFLYAGVRALEPGRELAGPLRTQHLWLVAGAVLLALSAWVRSIAAPLIPFFALWALLAIGGRWRARLVRAAVALVPAVALMLTYFAWHDATAGTFGLSRMGGWTIYSRVAPFADCSQFTPPRGTERLCQDQPSIERPGPDFYTWVEDSPARKLFGYPPKGNDKLAEWGWEALKAQPFDYVRTVSSDFARYFFPSLNDFRPYGTVGYDLIDIDRRDPPIEEDIRTNFLNPYYEDETPISRSEPVGWLGDLQQIIRIHPLLLFEALSLALFGMWWSSGRLRWGIALLAGFSVLMLGVAGASTYNARYAIPINGPMIAAGALGLWVVLRRFGERRLETGA